MNSIYHSCTYSYIDIYEVYTGQLLGFVRQYKDESDTDLISFLSNKIIEKYKKYSII